MNSAPFIGRQYELDRLNDLLHKKTASLVVINGRRRVGKSRLVEVFAKGKMFYRFSGLAPDKGITAQDQRNEFMLQLSHQTDFPVIKADDWSTIFQLLADKITTGRMIVLFDEITWMAKDDPTFLSKLKNAWDLYFKKNSQLIFIICGSISAWIEKNILSSTGYFGRVSLHLSLTDLPIQQSSQLLEKLGFKRSSLEKLMMISLCGGIPWYLEQTKPHLSVEKNIQHLCFEPQSLLLNEFKYIFHDLFGKRTTLYAKIVKCLVPGPLDYDALSNKLKYSKGSALTDYLNELEVCGYIKKYSTWELKTGALSKLSKYRLSDNFLRFYFRLMDPRLKAIKEGKFQEIAPFSIPGWWGIMGLQIENVVLNNAALISKSLGLNPIEIVTEGPYFQRASQRVHGVQIDYLIQTKLNTLFACEIKFSQNAIGNTVIREMRNKIENLSVPRRVTVLPVLIHCNTVMEEIELSNYFYKIINVLDFCDGI